MGCCLSSSNSKSPPSASSAGKRGDRYDFEPPKFLKSTAESRAPPPDFDEETVKEVVSSETPNPKPPPPHRPQPEPHYSAVPPPASPPNPAPVNPEPEEAIVHEKKEIRAPAPVVVEKEIRAEEEISEQDASEVCSVSVSVSMSESAMSTATTANDEEVMKKVGKGGSRRSPAGKVSAAARMNRAYSTADSGPRKEPRVVGRSPTRRSDRSPVKRNYSSGGGGGQMRMGQQQSKESGHNPAARRPLRPDPSMRDPGDSSRRRSRSPATHRSTAAAAAGVGSRNGSVKRANQSPGRVRKDPPEISPAASEATTKPGNGTTHRNNNDDEEDATAANESLENPLVSLECFIFL